MNFTDWLEFAPDSLVAQAALDSLPPVPSGVWLMNHLATALAITLALVGQLPAGARADELLPGSLLAPPKLSWTDVLGPVATVQPAEPVLPVFTTYDDALYELLSVEARSPGLQFSLHPDNDELFVGWQFEF